MSGILSFSEECLILDACCAITLFESDHMGEILSAVGIQPVMAKYVYDEEVKQADLGPYVSSGQLVIIGPGVGIEQINYVNFAAVLEDGEAITGAIAANRNWALATDEVKAINFFHRSIPHVHLVTTPDLVRNWMDKIGVSEAMVQEALRNIEVRGRYCPGPKHLLRRWWESHRA